MSEAWRELCALLREAGATMTFSANCRSGLIGERCQCWRCRKSRGEEVTEASEAEAAVLAADADKEWREKQREWFRRHKEPGA